MYRLSEAKLHLNTLAGLDGEDEDDDLEAVAMVPSMSMSSGSVERNSGKDEKDVLLKPRLCLNRVCALELFSALVLLSRGPQRMKMNTLFALHAAGRFRLSLKAARAASRRNDEIENAKPIYERS